MCDSDRALNSGARAPAQGVQYSLDGKTWYESAIDGVALHDGKLVLVRLGSVQDLASTAPQIAFTAKSTLRLEVSLPKPAAWVKQSEWVDAKTRRQSFNGWRVDYGDCDNGLYTADQMKAHVGATLARAIEEMEAGGDRAAACMAAMKQFIASPVI